MNFAINTNNISYDLEGKGMEAYIKSIGFNIIKYHGTGINGIALIRDGIKASTNGYCNTHPYSDI